MNAELEAKFEALAQTAVEEAEAVPCSLSDFAAGLDIMVDCLRQRLDQVNEELGE
jgi:hypothetical protein